MFFLCVLMLPQRSVSHRASLPSPSSSSSSSAAAATRRGKCWQAWLRYRSWVSSAPFPALLSSPFLTNSAPEYNSLLLQQLLKQKNPWDYQRPLQWGTGTVNENENLLVARDRDMVWLQPVRHSQPTHCQQAMVRHCRPLPHFQVLP